MSSQGRARPGRRIVVGMYVAILALTALFGFVIGTIRPDDLDPQLFWLIDLPSTPLGVALFGVLTVGLLLGLLLLLVEYVSKKTGAAE